MKGFVRLLLPALAVAICRADGTPVVPSFTLAPGAHIEGERLIADLPAAGSSRLDCRSEAPLDLTPWLGGADGVLVSVLVSAENVSEPDKPWNGVKAQLRCIDSESGRTRWLGASLPVGTYGWRRAEIRLGGLTAIVPENGRATLVLGLEGCSGHAEFNLASLRIEVEDVGLSPINQDWIVHYPGVEGFNAEAQSGRGRRELLSPLGDQGIGSLGENSKITPNLQNSKTPGSESNTNSASLRLCVKKTLRGCMLPSRPTTEDDIETLHRWGATLVRFQIVRGFGKIGVGADLDEYFRWLDGRLDNLQDVLGWCVARGMKVCVDLHSPPGGNSGLRQAEQYAMFDDDRHAAAFVDAWRRIARRFAGHPALYGYDLVNEPNQRGPVKNSYWELQRRAAEAIRKIDPSATIVVEANLSAAPTAFRYLSPLALDNVIYEVHFYSPGDYTHQGVGNRPRHSESRPLVWPGVSPEGRVWDKEHMRRILKPVRDFQLRHRCRIYVGEFSAVAWAPGAETWLRDAISLFEEYGWDWTYHAFREWSPWSVEHEGPDKNHMSPSSDNPRKCTLLEGFSR